MRAPAFFESVWQDFVYAARTFRLNTGFFAVAVLSLALGIGANTAIFQLLNAVRLRTLPVPQAGQLVQLRIADNDHCCSGNFSNRNSNFTFAQWEQIRDHQQAFSGIFAFGDTRFNLAQAGELRYAEGLWVSGDFFKTLRVQPLLGRVLTAADDHAGCGTDGAVISYAFWQKHFGGDPGVLSKHVLLDGHRFEVIGVTPASFYGVEVGKSFDVIVPACAEPLVNAENSHLGKRHHWWLAIIGRLKPGWTLARAAAQVQAISPAVFSNSIPPIYRPEQVKWYTRYKLKAQPGGGGVSSLRESYQQPLALLLGIAGLVLLIACSNLANLMLARASAREREMAVRLAIGADRARLIRQLLVESLTLTLSGAIAGAFLAQFLSSYLVTFLSTSENPLFVELGLDWRVLGFTAALAILTSILFGLTPALRATRTDPASAMKSSSRSATADRQRFGMRRALVISQVALSLVLLVGALLFVRSLRNLLLLDAGFQRDGLVIVGVDATRLKFPPERRAVLYRELLENLRRTAGVRDAATANIVQISGNGWNDSIEFPGRRATQRQVPWFDRVSSGYFRTMGTPLIAGRDFDTRDTASSPEVAIVNEEFARRFLKNMNPLGQEFRTMPGPGEPLHVYQIVGLVKNSKYQNLRKDFEPVVYLSASQDKTPDVGLNFIVRSGMPLATLMPALERTVLGQNGGLAFEFQVFNSQVENSLLRERLMARLSGFFGFLAAILATVGLYGVISYMVARRRSEIGIRIALGADRSGIVRLVLKEALLLLVAGLLVGCALAIASARTASSFLYGLHPNDPLTIIMAVGGLIAISLLASALPAWRAARVEPMSALREE
ncbi:MAG TPA: ABC transporter permease [Bryobacteraceae bacterium]|jgi:predicted permease